MQPKEPLKRNQWRPLLRGYGFETQNLGEFRTKVGGEVITGFTKHKTNGRIRVFEDTDRDGRFSRRDQLIANGRVEKDFRGMDNPLEFFESGKVKEGLERVETVWDPAGFLTQPILDFFNSDGDLVGRINFVQTSPGWEGCLG